MTIPGLAGGHFVAHLLLLLRRHRARQQRHPRRVLDAAELARHRQWTEHLAHRASVLGGKDFRRSEQGALIARVDHLCHGQHRHDRLPGTDLTLEHPVHRAVRFELRRQRLQHVLLARRQVERQLLRHRGQQSVVLPRRRWPRFAQFTVAAGDKGPLQTGGFIERQPLARAFALGLALRQMNCANGLVFTHQVALPDNRFRQRIGDGVEHIEHLTHAGVDVPALQLGVRRVDREEVTPKFVEQQLAAGIFRGFSNLRQRFGALTGIQDQEGRVGQLHCAAEISDFAGQHDTEALFEGVLDVLHVEEGRRHLGLPATERDDEILAFRRAIRPLQFVLRDGVDEGDVLTFLRRCVVLPVHRRSCFVLAGVVAHEVVHRADPEVLVERPGRLGADDEVEPVGQRDHYSTPINSASPR